MQDMTNYVVRPQLIRMLDWKAGILTGWTVSTEKSSKLCLIIKMLMHNKREDFTYGET